MKQKMIAVAAAALALVATTTAAQAETASASLHGFEMTLVDLDTTDGVNPWIAFDTSTVSAASAIVGSIDDFTQFTNVDTYGTSPFGAAASANARADATATAAVGGLPTLAGVTLTAAVTATAPDGFSASVAGLGSDGTSVNFGGVSFTLSAHTDLIITATADLSATGAGTAFGLASLQFLDASGYNVDQALAVSYFSAPSSTLSVSFTNAGDTASSGQFGAMVNALAQADATAVPEPAGTGLLAAGLGVLALIARKRRTRG